MFAYCGNNPVYSYDPSGCTAVTKDDLINAVGIGTGVGLLATLWNWLKGLFSGGSSQSSNSVGGNGLDIKVGSNSNDDSGKAEIKSIAGSTPATPPNNGNGRDYKKIRSNSRANEIAEKCGFKDAEALKEWYVGRANISKFNMYIDNATNEVILIAIQNGTVVPTGCIVP